MKTECEGDAKGDVFPLIGKLLSPNGGFFLGGRKPSPLLSDATTLVVDQDSQIFHSILFTRLQQCPRPLQQKNNAPRLLFQLESTKSRLAAYLQFVTFLTGTSGTLFPKCGNNQMLKMQRNVNCFATKYSNEHTRGGG